jgi:hypothetical protein
MPDIDSAALAAAFALPDQPRQGFEALHKAAETLLGVRMFTALAFDFTRQVTPRLYSSHEAIYPANAEDPLGDTIWEHTLTVLKQPLVLNDPTAMATLLPNVPQLVAIGCEAMINLPIIVAGEPLGTLNMLAESGKFTPEVVARAAALSPAAATLFLWARRPT